MGVQHKEDNRCIRATLRRALVKVMYHEFYYRQHYANFGTGSARFGYRRAAK